MTCNGGKTDGDPLVRRQVGTSSLTMAIVRAVAAAENEAPQSLGPLGDVVAPDALEVLLEESDRGVHVTFSYAGYRLVVTRDAVEVH